MAIIKQTVVEAPNEEPRPQSFEDVENVKARLFHSENEALRIFGVRRHLGIGCAILAAVCSLAFVPLMREVTDMQALVVPEKMVEIGAPKFGKLSEVKVGEGDAIEKGDVLVRITNPEDDEKIREDESEIKILESELSGLETRRIYWFERFEADRRLLAKHTISKDEFRKTELEFAGLEEDRNSKKARLGWLKEKLRFLRQEKEEGIVKAPVSGKVISDPETKEGSFVSKGDFLMTLAASGHLVEFLLREEEYDRIKAGDKARVRFYAFPDKTYSGAVVKVKHYAEPLEKNGFKTRAVKVLIRLEDIPQEIKNGMSARADIRGQAVSLAEAIRRRI